MGNEDIIDALENTALNPRDRGRLGDPTVADHGDVVLWRNRLMRFFEDLDGDYTVDDIRSALEDYQ